MNTVDHIPATPENVWEAFRETDRLIKESRAEFKQDLAESRAEFKQGLAESRNKFEHDLAESRNKFEQDLAESRAEFKQGLAESRAEFDKRMKESDEKFDNRMKASDEKYERRMKNLDDRYGSHSQNLGSFAEEYFFNSFEKGERHFFNEEFDDIKRNLATGLNEKIEDEYDIVLLNGKSVAIIEVKFKAHKNDLPKVVKKAKTFRTNYPKYQNHKIFLGLASMAFYPELEKKCIREGIAIVKQVGDAIVINKDHLKAF